MLPSLCHHLTRQASPCLHRLIPRSPRTLQPPLIVGSKYNKKTSRPACLQQAVIVLNPTALGFESKDIEARSLRSGGAMALLCGNVDTTDKISLLGRWKSDAMLRYLHVKALPLSYRFSERMIAHGNFTLYPGVAVPQAVVG